MGHGAHESVTSYNEALTEYREAHADLKLTLASNPISQVERVARGRVDHATEQLAKVCDSIGLIPPDMRLVDIEAVRHAFMAGRRELLSKAEPSDDGSGAFEHYLRTIRPATV